MSGRSRRWPRTIAALTALAAAAACGVPTDDGFHGVNTEEVPFGLAAAVTTTRPGTTTTTTTVPTSAPVKARLETVTLYYVVGQSLLTAVERELDKPVSLGTVIASLAVGPSQSEQQHGYRSVVRFGHVVNVDTGGGVATVDLSTNFLELASPEQRLAIAQLVFTLTARPGIGQVTFTLEGAPVAVPLPDGSLVSAPLTREAFPSMLFTPATVTTDAAPAPGPQATPGSVLGSGP